MKTIKCIACLIALSSLFITKSIFAQSANVISAYNYMNAGDFANAREYIDKATEHEKTKENAKTWFYRGQIYHAIYESSDPNVKALDNEALFKAFESYVASNKLDEKGRYKKDVDKRLQITELQFINYGAEAFNQQDYARALKAFESAKEIAELPQFGKIDTIAVENAGITAQRLNNTEKAKKYYSQLIDLKYGGSKYYSLLSRIILEEADTMAAISVLQNGRNAFPDDQMLIIDELNLYLTMGKDVEAKKNLHLAIEKDPQNVVLHFALGTIYDKLKEFENAEEAYLKAIEVNPEYFDAVYNLGALFFNKGAEIDNLANQMEDFKKAKEEKKKVDELFAKALPHLEKAFELNPEDRNTLISLKQLYVRMGKTEEYNKVMEQLKNL